MFISQRFFSCFHLLPYFSLAFLYIFYYYSSIYFFFIYILCCYKSLNLSSKRKTRTNEKMKCYRVNVVHNCCCCCYCCCYWIPCNIVYNTHTYIEYVFIVYWVFCCSFDNRNGKINRENISYAAFIWFVNFQRANLTECGALVRYVRLDFKITTAWSNSSK